jgi:hypothetical protein
MSREFFRAVSIVIADLVNRGHYSRVLRWRIVIEYHHISGMLRSSNMTKFKEHIGPSMSAV